MERACSNCWFELQWLYRNLSRLKAPAGSTFCILLLKFIAVRGAVILSDFPRQSQRLCRSMMSSCGPQAKRMLRYSAWSRRYAVRLLVWGTAPWLWPCRSRYDGGCVLCYSREYKPVIKLMIGDVSQAAHGMSQEHTHAHTHSVGQGMLRAWARPRPRRHVAVATAPARRVVAVSPHLVVGFFFGFFRPRTCTAVPQ